MNRAYLWKSRVIFVWCIAFIRIHYDTLSEALKNAAKPTRNVAVVTLKWKLVPMKMDWCIKWLLMMTKFKYATGNRTFSVVTNNLIIILYLKLKVITLDTEGASSMALSYSNDLHFPLTLPPTRSKLWSDSSFQLFVPTTNRKYRPIVICVCTLGKH